MKIIYAAFAFLLILAGCSTDSDVPTGVLLRKLVQTTNDDQHVANYHYDGNRLDYIVMNDDDVLDYTYSGDLISEISRENMEGEELQRTIFYYEDGLLVKSHLMQFWTDFEMIVQYAYNPDGTVNFTSTSTSWDGSMQAGNPGKHFFDSQGSLIKTEQYGPGGTLVTEYQYDQQKNPYRNIAGYSRLMDFFGGMHNVTSISGMVATTYQYNYNSAGYPVSGTRVAGSQASSMEYFY